MLRSILAAGAGLAALATTQPAFADDHSEPESTLSAPEIEFTEWKLDNGLRVIAMPDDTTGTVTTSLWYDVGSKNDPAGRSGFAHLFEHILSRKTENMPYNMIYGLTADVGDAEFDGVAMGPIEINAERRRGMFNRRDRSEVTIAGRIEASVLFETVTVEDILPANMRYEVGSAQPPAVWDARGRSLTWTLSQVPEAGIGLSFRVFPTEPGQHPTNVEARARFRDGFDQPGEVVFPVPIVEVLPGEPGSGCVCRITRLKAPQPAIDLALANPDRIWGWNRLLDEGKPGSPPWPEPGYDAPPNPRRTCLDIWNRGIPYHPLFNSVVWRAGCTEGPAAP